MKRVLSLWLPTLSTDRWRRAQRRKLLAESGIDAAQAGANPTSATARPSSCEVSQAPQARPAFEGHDKPVAATHAVQGGIRLAAVDTAGLKSGIKSGLSLADARTLVPGLEIFDYAPDEDLGALERLADWCQRYTPWVSLGEAPNSGGGDLWLDISGCGHLFGGESGLVEDLLKRLTKSGLNARVGVADTPGAAWAVGHFMRGNKFTILPPGRLTEPLSRLPVAALRLPREIVEALSKVGLRRIGDIAPLPRAPLAARFGDVALMRLDQALGRMSEPLSPRPCKTEYRSRMAFAEAIARREDIDEALEQLLEALCKQLGEDDRGARRLTFTCHRMDASQWACSIGTGQPERDPAHLFRLFREKLDGIDPGFGIEVMILAATLTAPLAPEQHSIAKQSRQGEVVHLIDRLGNRFGDSNVVRLTPKASHIPELAQGFKPAAEVSSGHQEEWERYQRTVPSSLGYRPRPVHLLRRPSPIEVMAAVPDGPPMLFLWRGQRHRVVKAEGPERLAPEWWQVTARKEITDHETGVRDYFRIEDTTGKRFWLYRRGLYRPQFTPSWYLHGVFV
jgi:protein ImuB